MIYVTAAAVLAALATTSAALMYANILRSTLRQSARERDLLVNQVCHLAKNPWLPPPSAPAEAPGEPHQELYIVDPTVPAA